MKSFVHLPLQKISWVYSIIGRIPMGNYTKQDIIQLVEEKDVQFIRLQFTDVSGNLKNVAITASLKEH